MEVEAVEGVWGGTGGQVEASFYHARGPAGNPILSVSFSAVLIWLCPSLEGNEREQGNQSPEILGPLWKKSWGIGKLPRSREECGQQGNRTAGSGW